jgi:RNA polymerase sigma factor (TIGR02999 family)
LVESGERAEPITEWLEASRRGDGSARERLIEALYGELRRAASRELRRFRGFETLQTTALVNEAYLRLLAGGALPFESRVHLLSVAAVAMRRLLIDRARERLAAKRGGGARAETLDDEAEQVADRAGEQLLDLDGALAGLERLDPHLARVVELRFFGGLTEVEVSHALGSSERTVRRDWVKARAFLHRYLSAS